MTGATGFLAGWCVIELLRRGHLVRATVRDTADADRVRAELRALAPQAHLDPTTLETLELATADLTADDGWEDAVCDCTGVLHVASPFPERPPRDPDDLLRPARDGTIRVLSAADRAAVRRVVVTPQPRPSHTDPRHNGLRSPPPRPARLRAEQDPRRAGRLAKQPPT
ncbi:NAD(P)H-binding protein [Asanoa sp. NPDC049518]|uniref:NAD-dependent epimerase/dehydratase family protein n=1 Tax=unclassified Asanoa TaxID=2685164 RepID=UPI0034231E37